MVIVASLLILVKISLPISGALPKKMILVMPEQLKKAPSPMLVTLSGMVTLVRLVHL